MRTASEALPIRITLVLASLLASLLVAFPSVGPALPAAASSTSVVVFSKDPFTDSDEEDAEITAALQAEFGDGNVTVFDGGDGSAAAWTTALTGKDVLVIPERNDTTIWAPGRDEQGGDGFPILDEAMDYIRTWASDGRLVIGTGSYSHTAIIEFLTEVDLPSFDDSDTPWLRSPSLPTSLPASLPVGNYTGGFTGFDSWTDEQQAVVEPLYVSESGDNIGVARFIVGAGSYVYLAYDWYPDEGDRSVDGAVKTPADDAYADTVTGQWNLMLTLSAGGQVTGPVTRSAPAATPQPVADPGGGIPFVAPGASTGSVGGVSTTPTPARPNSGAAEFQVGTVETRVDVALGAAGRVTGSGTSPVIEVARDRVAQLTGGGMQPGGIAQVWMPLPDGGSRQVALLPIAADGTFDGALPFTGELDGRGPLPIGERTIQLFGIGADGQLTVINFGVRIEQPGPLAPEADRGQGAPPALTPGQSLVTVAGLPTRVTVTPAPDARSTRIAGDGWLMDVDVPEGTVRDETGAPLIQVVNGSDSRVRGNGFMPGTRVFVWLMSDPTFLGEVTVAADGSFSGDVTVDGVAAGEHTLQVSGVGTDGYVRAANLGVIVTGGGGPIPTRIPAGEGQHDALPLFALVAIVSAAGFAAGLAASGGRRRAGAGVAGHIG